MKVKCWDCCRLFIHPAAAGTRGYYLYKCLGVDDSRISQEEAQASRSCPRFKIQGQRPELAKEAA